MDAGVDQHLEEVAGIHHGGTLPARAGDRHEVMVQDEDLQRRGSGELVADPVVVDPPHLTLVQIGLARVDADDPDVAEVVGPHPRSDQILEVEVADVARVVIAGNREQGRLDAVGIGEPRLVLRPEPIRGEVSGNDHDIGTEFVEFGYHAVHQVGHEVRRPDVRIGDVGDRCHVPTLSTWPYPAGPSPSISTWNPCGRTPGRRMRHDDGAPIASSVSGGRSSRSKASSDGPAPETQTGTCARRSSPITSATSGIAARRASSCNRSTSAANRSAGSRVSASTASAACATFATAAARETGSGSTARAAAVVVPKSGTTTA